MSDMNMHVLRPGTEVFVRLSNDAGGAKIVVNSTITGVAVAAGGEVRYSMKGYGGTYYDEQRFFFSAEEAFAAQL